MAGAIVMVAIIAKWGALFGSDTGEGGNTIVAIVTAVVAPIAATIIQMTVSRSREYLADQGGAQVAGVPTVWQAHWESWQRLHGQFLWMQIHQQHTFSL